MQMYMFLLLTTITDLFILYRENYTGKYEICIYIYISCVYVDVCFFLFWRLNTIKSQECLLTTSQVAVHHPEWWIAILIS